MEHVNNDMDDLFRKAGELYPLKTSESDWDGVLGKLQEEISGESSSFSNLQSPGSKNKLRRWLLFMVLIPISVFSVVYFSRSDNKTKTVLPPDAVNSQQIPDNLQKVKSPGNATVPANPTADKKISFPDEAETRTDRVKTSDNKGVVASGKTIPGSLLHTNSSPNRPNDRDRASAGAKGEILSAGVTANRLNSSGTKNISGVSAREVSRDPMKKTLSLTAISSNKNPSVYGMPFPQQTGTGVALNTNGAHTATRPAPDKLNSSKGVYAVLIGGPDLSTVAHQSTSQAGYSIGVLLGYRFNKRLAIETGLLWDKKYYYSSGEHFNKSAANLPYNWNILNLNGNCEMFEIPLNFRYNFASGKDHGFFAEAGLSSYLMKKEYYDYSYTYNGSTPHSRDSTYNKSSNYIFSVIQISAGYEHTIGRNTSIRIEPYLKIPLQGIGIGNMPVTSAGLYIGISHNFR